MSTKILLIAAAVSTAAPSASLIALPDYGDAYDSHAALDVPLTVCAADMRARIEQGDATVLPRFAQERESARHAV